MWQILTIGVLLAIMIGLESFAPAAAPNALLDPKSLAATGFIVLAAFTMGDLFRRFKLPALLGYIAAGIVFGPNLAKLVLGPESGALFNEQVIRDLGMINVLTVGVIGTMGGGELKVGDIRDTWKVIVTIIGLIILTAIPLTVGVVMVLPYIPLPIIGFLGDQGTMSKLACAILFGIFATAMSPAATLAILQETRAKGKFTSLVLGIVVVADLALVALFLVGLSFSKLLMAPGGFKAEALVAALPGIAMEFGWALVIGVVTGAIFILYIRFVAREMMLFSVGIIFAASYVSKIVHGETLLAFLTAGFVVQNFSRHGHDLIHSLERISLPVFIIYFMTQAAQLDLAPVVTYLPLTLILAAVRGGVFYGAVKLGAKVWNTSELTQRFLWLAFFSRGGVDLVLAAMVADGIPEWGTAFQTVIMSTVVVHIVVGPPLLKIALTHAGETEESRERSQEEVADIGAIGARKDLGAAGEFLAPRFEDRFLNEHLLDLREQLQQVHSELIAKPFEQRRERLESSVLELRKEATDALTRLSEILNAERFQSDEARIKAVRALHTHYRRRLKVPLRQIQTCERLTFSADSAQTLLLRIQSMERFENQHIVEMEPALEVPEGGRGVRLLRAVRRVRRRVAGPGRRTVPVGQLWRFYVELAVPRLMAGAAQGAAQSHIDFWQALGHTLRELDEIFRVSMELLAAPPAASDAPTPPPADEHGEDGHVEAEHEEPEADVSLRLDARGHVAKLELQGLDGVGRARAFLGATREEAVEALEDIRRQLTEAMEATTRGYSWSLQQAYGEFLDAARCAGTLELPAFRYRASLQFDRARRAEAQLRASLKEEADTISGLLGWMTIEQQLVPFLSWFEDYQQRVLDTLRGNLQESCARQLDRLKVQCRRLAGDDVPSPASWGDLYTRDLAQTSRLTRRALDRSLVAFGQGVASRRLIDTLEVEVAAFAEELVLLVQDPDSEELSGGETIRLRARAWFSNRLVNEIALRYIEFNERTERLLRRTMVGLDDVDQVLEFNLTSAQNALEEGEPENAREVAVTALHRAAKLVEQLHEGLFTDMREIERWIQQELRKLAQEASAPLLQHNIAPIRRDLARHAIDELRAEHWSRKNLDPMVERARRVWSTVAPLYEELVEDVRAILREEPRQEQRAQVRARLHMEHALVPDDLPPIYKRLFNPVPLDLPDFYVPRAELERRLLDSIARWGEGLPTSILLFGDRGIGKRTFIHNLVPIRIYDLAPIFQDIPIQTVRLGEELETEVELCHQLAPLVAGEPPEQMAELARRIQSGERRQIVILENANKCYSRTREGLALCRSFLNLMNETSGRVLWVVLMDAPAATLLDHMIDLFDFFTHAFELEPLDEASLERMILKRHRVSGFGVDFLPNEARLLQRLTHPLASREARRNPQRAFFDRLAHASHGNPLLALMLWIEHIQLAPNNATTLTVSSLQPPTQELIEGLTLAKRLILAMLLQHGSATEAQVSRMLDRPASEIALELEMLQRLGFIEQAVGSAQSWRLRNLAAPQVTSELRRHNLV